MDNKRKKYIGSEINKKLNKPISNDSRYAIERNRLFKLENFFENESTK